MLYENNRIRMYRGDINSEQELVEKRDVQTYCERIQRIYGHMDNLYPHLGAENIIGTKLTVNMKDFKHIVCSPWPCFTSTVR